MRLGLKGSADVPLVHGQLFEPQVHKILRFNNATGMIAGDLPLRRFQPGQQTVQTVVCGVKCGE